MKRVFLWFFIFCGLGSIAMAVWCSHDAVTINAQWWAEVAILLACAFGNFVGAYSVYRESR